MKCEPEMDENQFQELIGKLIDENKQPGNYIPENDALWGDMNNVFKKEEYKRILDEINVKYGNEILVFIGTIAFRKMKTKHQDTIKNLHYSLNSESIHPKGLTFLYRAEEIGLGIKSANDRIRNTQSKKRPPRIDEKMHDYKYNKRTKM